MKKVLVITYYWPPSGGSGVQRWLKMQKYLAEFGWLPVIYTADNAEYPVEDASLQADVRPDTVVLRKNITEPYSFYKKFLGLKKSNKIKAGFITEKKKTGWKENLSIWIRGNFFIPDARCWWIRPSVRFLLKYTAEHPVDAIISTGPPHSMHLIGMKLHRKTGIPWVADFRDPWTDIDYFPELKLTAASFRKHLRLEREVLETADKVVTVGSFLVQNLQQHGAKQVELVYNGFDFSLPKTRTPQPGKFVIAHLGVIPASRNAENLWQALRELLDELDGFANDLELQLTGQVDVSVVESLNAHGLQPYVKLIPYLPYAEAAEAQRSAAVLLLLINNTPQAKGILSGKLFEYLAANRPILAVGPADGDVASILQETQAGHIAGFDDKNGMKTIVENYYKLFQNRQLLCHSDMEAIDRYSRRNLAGKYADILQQTQKTKI